MSIGASRTYIWAYTYRASTLVSFHTRIEVLNSEISQRKIDKDIANGETSIFAK
jgi:hypothetical protein